MIRNRHQLAAMLARREQIKELLLTRDPLAPPLSAKAIARALPGHPAVRTVQRALRAIRAGRRSQILGGASAPRESTAAEGKSPNCIEGR